MNPGKEAIKSILLKAFDIREGEVLRASLMQVNIFLIISVLLMVKSTVNGLFLARFGAASLPNAFILTAVAAALVSTLYARVLLRVTLLRIMIWTLSASVFALVFFGIGLRLNLAESVILYVFYIWGAIFALLATSQFWVLANLIFNAREAKRLFGFIGAGAIAGGIFGGYLTSALTQVLSGESLLFICAALLSICIPITQRVWKSYVVDSPIDRKKRKRIRGFGDHPVSMILSSRHLSLVAALVGLSVVVAKLVDFQFAGVAAAVVDDPDDLTAFFGFWFSTFNIISLGLQLLLTRRIVGTFGVGASLFFLPTFIFFAASLLFIFPEVLMVAVLLKMSDGSLKQSINKAAMELIILPIPTEIKNQTKTFIDVFIDSLATGISGLILIFLIDAFDVSTRGISLLILLLVVGWMYLAHRVRREYLRSFKAKLEPIHDADAARKAPDISDADVLEGMRRVLQKGSEKQILYVLGQAREAGENRLFDSIVALLDHPAADVRAEALRALQVYRKNPLLDRVHQLTRDPSQQVKIGAFEYLIQHEPEDKLALMVNYLQDVDYRVQGAALVCIARETSDNAILRDLFQLNFRIGESLAELKHITNEAELRSNKISIAKAIGYARLPKLYPYLVSFMEDADREVAQHALVAAGNSLSPEFVGVMVGFLANEDLRESARKGLLKYGSESVAFLAHYVKQANTPVESIRVFPAILKEINSQEAVNLLFELLDYGDMVVRKEALRALNRLRSDHPYLRFHSRSIPKRILEEAQLYQDTLSALYGQIQIRQKNHEVQEVAAVLSEAKEARLGLITLLERRLDGNLERIFRLLGLKYPSEDVYSIYRNIRSEKQDLRLNALEFLDNLLEPSLRKVLIPIIETAMVEGVSEAAVRKLNLRIPNEFECLGMLLQGKDVRIKFSALYLIGQLNDQAYIPLLNSCKQSESAKIRQVATDILTQLQA